MMDHWSRYRWLEAAKTRSQRNLFQSEHTNCLSPHVDISIYSIPASEFSGYHLRLKFSENISWYLFACCQTKTFNLCSKPFLCFPEELEGGDETL